MDTTTPALIAQAIMLGLLEVVLGMDNILMLNLLAGGIAPAKRKMARTVGVIQGVTMRIALVATLSYVMRVAHFEFTLLGHTLTVHSALLLGGGLFLLWKAGNELYQHTKAVSHHERYQQQAAYQTSVAPFMGQALLMSAVFSLDSVFTALGMTSELWVMVLGILIGASAMVFAVNIVGEYLERYPSLKTLALAFVLSIGLFLFAEGVNPELAEQGVSNYIYFGMFYALGVVVINLVREENHKDTERAVDIIKIVRNTVRSMEKRPNTALAAVEAIVGSYIREEETLAALVFQDNDATPATHHASPYHTLAAIYNIAQQAKKGGDKQAAMHNIIQLADMEIGTGDAG